jgi:hypothetical protein
VAWGLLGALANVPILVTLQAASSVVFRWLPEPHHPLEDLISANPPALTIAAMFFVAAVQAPFSEEVLFRGTLFPALSTVLKSPIWGGLASSLIFAMIHPTGIPAWPMLAAIGGMSAFLCYRTGSLVPSVVMHAAHNAATVAIALAIS